MSQVLAKYDVVLVDQYGVLHNGTQPMIGAVDCFNRMIEAGKRVVLVSKHCQSILRATGQAWCDGFSTDFQGVTGGDVCHEYVQGRRAHTHAARSWLTIGQISLKDEPGLDFPRSGRGDRGTRQSSVPRGRRRPAVCYSDCVAEALATDYRHTNTPNDAINEFLRGGLERKLPLLCPNSDAVGVVENDRFVYMGGGIAKLYEEKGGEVVYFGKPTKEHFEVCLQLANVTDKSKVTRCHHDIQGATNVGVDSILIAGGVHAKQLEVDAWSDAEEDHHIKPELLDKLLGETELDPTYTRRASSGEAKNVAIYVSQSISVASNQQLNSQRRWTRRLDAQRQAAPQAPARAAASTGRSLQSKEDVPIKQEQNQVEAAVTEAASQDDVGGEQLNAKERRRLARLAKQNTEVVTGGDEPEARVATPESTKVATPTDDDQKLNAQQRRLLKRQAKRKTDGVEDKKPPQKKQKKTEAPDDDGKPDNSQPQNMIRSHFAEAGDIKLRMLTDKKTKKFKGTAFIEVKDSKALGAALSRHHTLMQGRRINGGGNKSENRRNKIDLLRKKQSNVQVEKTKALIQKHIDGREYKLKQEDVDDRMIDFLSWFDYETAKKALDEYNRCVSDKVNNRKAFFMGILKRFRQTDGVE
ncbi:HAD-like domain [Phytophthora cactorum]|nr:HAD-like domain [Phytophthora cactorum]